MGFLFVYFLFFFSKPDILGTANGNAVKVWKKQKYYSYAQQTLHQMGIKVFPILEVAAVSVLFLAASCPVAV